VLKQVGETYELPIAARLIETYARIWATNKRDYVLIEEVEDWIVDNDIQASVRYLPSHYECDPVEYFLVFAHYPEAFSFMLRWA
jgi:hypothetical protein